MTKGLKKKISDPLPRGSSLFDMDFTSEGLSWVKDIYQKLETSCTEYVDACNKYAHTAGEHFQKIYDEVREWENSSDGCVKGPVSNLSLKHDVIIEVSNKSLAETDENSSNEKLGPSDKVRATVSLSEDSSLVSSSNEPQVLSYRDACDGDKEEESLSIEAINCSDDAGEAFMKISDTVTSPADLTSSLRQDDALTLESRHGGGSSIDSSCISSIEINGTCTSQETILLLDSLGNEHEPQIKPEKLEASVQSPEIVPDFWPSDGREDIMSNNPDVVTWNAETEEFEDVKPEDCWDDAEKNEIALISHRTSKNMSYKKKLRNVFISKVRSWKDYNLVDDQCDGVEMEMQNRQMIAVSSVRSGDFYPKTSLTQDSIESEWELL